MLYIYLEHRREKFIKNKTFLVINLSDKFKLTCEIRIALLMLLNNVIFLIM